MAPLLRHLYVHIPFCPSKCAYCAFVTHIGSLKLAPPYVAAVAADIAASARKTEGGSLSTVYFGGGTPSMLEPEQIHAIISAADAAFEVEANAEISMEAHPSTVNPSQLQGYRQAGVNRISFGVESLQPAELRAIGRKYEPSAVGRAVAGAREASFSSVALDLIYGLPGQSRDSWERTLDQAISLGVDHFSCYPLSIEPATPYARASREGRLLVPDDDQVARMYEVCAASLADAGFVHYELSNWARPNHECRHNLAYWRHEEYLGVGVGAHSYLRPVRSERVRGVSRYIEIVGAGKSPVDHVETVDDEIEREEALMLHLRLLQEGLDLARYRARFGTDLESSRGAELDRLDAAGMVHRRDGRIRLTQQAVPLANEVFAALM